MSKKPIKNSNKKTAQKKSSRALWWIIIGVVIAAVLAAAVIALTRGSNVQETAKSNGGTAVSVKEGTTVKVKVEMEKGGSFIMELYPEYAPQTVENFVDLVTEGFYDGVGFHRVIDGFMAQGGDPEGTGMGGSGTSIVGEFATNGFAQNTLSHERGVVSMARSQDPDSASSQFFICYDDASFLDGNYAAFGKVIEGMEVVDSFLEVERVGMEGGTPTEPITMKRVTIVEE